MGLIKQEQEATDFSADLEEVKQDLDSLPVRDRGLPRGLDWDPSFATAGPVDWRRDLWLEVAVCSE